MLISHPKKRGEWVEMQFMARAAAHGLSVSKPWGDSCRYDFIVEHNGRFSRVQVKSTSFYRERDGWIARLRRPCGGYSESEIDFVAVYILPRKAWYIVPIGLVAGHAALSVDPRRRRKKFEKYREAWHLLRGQDSRHRKLKAVPDVQR